MMKEMEITLTPEQKQLIFFLYSLCSESYEKMVELVHYIDQTCLTCETLWCRELAEFLDLKWPEEFKNYGWTKPRRYYNDGWFYIYSGKDDHFWHIEVSIPEKINI